MEIKDLITPKYVNADEFRTYTGIDLALELKRSDDPSNDANRELKRVEDKCINFLMVNYDFKEELINMSDNSLLKFKIGVYEQLKSEIMSNCNISISELAIIEFRMGGLANIKRF